MRDGFSEMFSGWGSFIDLTKGRGPRPLVARALPFVGQRRRALDLGAGALNDTRYLLDQGFEAVVAVDPEPQSAAVAEQLADPRLRHIQKAIGGTDLGTGDADLIVAQFVLPFLGAELAGTLARIAQALRPGAGVVTGQLFGDRDDWAGSPRVLTHTRQQALSLLDGLEIKVFEEEYAPNSAVADGRAKCWHIWHFIALAKGAPDEASRS